jgi:peptide/nickel transport system permease protein
MTAGAMPNALMPAAEPESSGQRGSFWSQVLRQTLRRGGAQAGLVWIAVLAFAAIFAPVLANTEPFLIKVNGRMSSPMIHHLSPTDVTLFVLTIAVIVAWRLKRISPARRTIGVGIVLVVTIVTTLKFVRPPATVDWQEFRDLAREGRVQYKLMAPLPYSANDYERDDPDQLLQPPSWAHPLGTEINGGDVLSRMIHATRTALSIGLVSTGISVVIGVFIGGLMGYFAGRTDILGMRLIEIFEAIPVLFLLITFVAFFQRRDLIMIMVIIGLTGWTDEARFIRAEFLRLRKQDFVYAAVASGLPLRSILFRHLLPNGVAPILVTSSFGIASAILFESILSFLGLGPVDQPSWGQMLNQSLGVGGSFVWWIAMYPGLAIFLTVFAYNLLGEALRDALDPKLTAVK